jgi:hypothetical protein
MVAGFELHGIQLVAAHINLCGKLSCMMMIYTKNLLISVRRNKISEYVFQVLPKRQKYPIIW